MKKSFMRTLAVTSSIFALLPFNCLSANAVKNDWDTSWKGGGTSFEYCNDKYGGIHSLCSAKSDTSGRNRSCCIREKGDYSSIYVYNKSSKAVEVKVWGENSFISPNLDSDTATKCKGYTSISTNSWSVPKYSERFIPQYIKENKFTYAHIHFNTAGTNGLWSADSSGWYPNADTK